MFAVPMVGCRSGSVEWRVCYLTVEVRLCPECGLVLV